MVQFYYVSISDVSVQFYDISTSDIFVRFYDVSMTDISVRFYDVSRPICAILRSSVVLQKGIVKA